MNINNLSLFYEVFLFLNLVYHFPCPAVVLNIPLPPRLTQSDKSHASKHQRRWWVTIKAQWELKLVLTLNRYAKDAHGFEW